MMLTRLKYVKNARAKCRVWGTCRRPQARPPFASTSAAHAVAWCRLKDLRIAVRNRAAHRPTPSSAERIAESLAILIAGTNCDKVIYGRILYFAFGIAPKPSSRATPRKHTGSKPTSAVEWQSKLNTKLIRTLGCGSLPIGPTLLKALS